MKTSLFNKLFLCAAVLAVGMLSDTRVHAQSAFGGWTNRYDGSGNADDITYGVVTDRSGSVFVTGSSIGSGTGRDYVTIKYSDAGVPLWTNRYDGPGNADDIAYDIALDGNGNVFVTGYSTGSGSGHDYVTIAYSSAGVPLWTNRYNGPGNVADDASAVAVDGSGNVFVTGFSNGSGSRHDYATIKYSNAGVPLWTNRYNGPGNNDDDANAVAVDGSGNVFVTGSSTGSISGYDYSTIKYSGAGVPLWTNRYSLPINHTDEAFSVAVDDSSNVIVTGYSYITGGNSDFATIKYSNAGVPLWTNRYNGPGNSYDFATRARVDADGNVFVTGRSTGSGSGYDYMTIKYSSAGVLLWTNRYNGPANTNDFANDLALDGGGNVIVTGRSSNGSNYDYTTIKYSNTGVPLWTNRYDGSGNADDGVNAVVTDGSGSVFVTGYSIGSGSGRDYVTIKYSSVGGPLLTIARTTTNTLALSWPSPAADFTLQQNTNVATTNWVPVGITPADDGTNKTVIVDPLGGNKFYRLIHL